MSVQVYNPLIHEIIDDPPLLGRLPSPERDVLKKTWFYGNDTVHLNAGKRIAFKKGVEDFLDSKMTKAAVMAWNSLKWCGIGLLKTTLIVGAIGITLIPLVVGAGVGALVAAAGIMYGGPFVAVIAVAAGAAIFACGLALTVQTGKYFYEKIPIVFCEIDHHLTPDNTPIMIWNETISHRFRPPA